jgi:hypothetical protein
VVGGCKELSAGEDSCLCFIDFRREFFIAADAWKDTRHGAGCNSLLGRIAGCELYGKTRCFDHMDRVFILWNS